MSDATIDFAEQYPLLYVDDEEDNLVVFDATFEDEFKIYTCQSGDEALQILAEHDIAVLLADKRMPGMDGIELCATVRDRYPHVQRMLITAFSDQKTAIEAINRAGVEKYVVKPWREDDLREVLRAALTRTRMEKLAGDLDDAMVENERLHAVAAERARVLHDLANISQCLVNASANLDDLVPRIEKSAPPDLAKEVAEEVAGLAKALDIVVALQHEQPRSQAAAEPPPEPSLAAEIVRTVARVVQRPLENANIKLALSCPAELLLDARRISVSRILVNLIKNAQEALEDADIAEGRIQVDVRAGGGRMATIDVVDNGAGVAPDKRQWIFEESNSTKEKTGRGIGLAVSRDLAIADGGNLELLDESPLGGAAFRLTVPISSRSAARPPDSSTTAPHGQVQPADAAPIAL